jgi:organic hydroperoxide reductase OsmC/OhrA
MPGDDGDVRLTQVERYEFSATYGGEPFPAATVDEAPPVGKNAGPNPVQTLALAVGHCMSSTLVSTLERAHVAVAPIRTTVWATVGRNERGRLRVQGLRVEIRTRPLDEADRPRFDHCLEIFEDFCTVSGAVRAGIPIASHVGPDDGATA